MNLENKLDQVFHTDKIWTIENFLSLDECIALIQISENIGYIEAEVNLIAGSQMMRNI